MIESMTPEQEQEMLRYRDEWMRNGLSTEPCDPAVMRSAVSSLYDTHGLPAVPVICMDSPFGCLIARAIICNKGGGKTMENLEENLRANLEENLRENLWENLWVSLRANLRENLGENLWENLCISLRANLRENLEENLRANLEENLREKKTSGPTSGKTSRKTSGKKNLGANLWGNLWVSLGENLRENLGVNLWENLGENLWENLRGGGIYGYPSLLGNHDVGWLAFYEFPVKLGHDYPKELIEKLTATVNYAKSCGVLYAYKNLAIVSNRPSVLNRDAAGRLHSETGMAMQFRDGYGFYAWHGVRVPAKWIEDRANLDPNEVIKVSNVEQRAAGAAICGWQKMLSVLKQRVIDRHPNPEIGSLIELSLPGLDRPGRFLKAQCPRNGMICEGVPYVSDIDGLPIETAIAAQAWRLGDAAAEFQISPKRT